MRPQTIAHLIGKLCSGLVYVFFLTIAAQLSISAAELPVAEQLDTVRGSQSMVQSGNGENRIAVTRIEVLGNSILQSEIENLTQPLINQTVSVADLNSLAESITGLYLNGGYITSKAFLPEQSFEGGLVKIEVQEGSVEIITIEGTVRLNSYVRSRVELGTTTPLNSGNLENQLRLLKNSPLFENIEATLKPGSGTGKSVVEVYITEANPLFGGVGIDNYSPPSVGGTQANINLGHRNVLGLGDSIFVQYTPRLESFTGTYQIDTFYRIPLNPMDGALQFRASIQNNAIIQEEFQDLDISQESQYYEISFRQPLIRTPEEELALSLGFGYRDNQTFDFQGPSQFLFYSEDGKAKTSVLFFGQDYVIREPLGAWAFRSQFRLGTSWFDATDNEGNVPDGQFFSWLTQLQRVQILDRNNFLIVQLDAQLTPDSLLPSEQFVIGGAQSVRGYAQNARSGDSGVRFSIEDRITLIRNSGDEPVFLIAPFFDMGYVWNNSNEFSFQESQRFIAGLGLGFIWQPLTGMSVRLDYAPPLVYLNNRGNNIQDNGLYFNVNYQF